MEDFDEGQIWTGRGPALFLYQSRWESSLVDLTVPMEPSSSTRWDQVKHWPSSSDSSTNTAEDGDRWVGPSEKEPTATDMALGTPKKKQHHMFGVLGAHMGEEQSLASSNPDSTKASKRDISMGSCALPRSRMSQATKSRSLIGNGPHVSRHGRARPRLRLVTQIGASV